MIVDLFLYDGEREMLEARLDALDGLVDAHVAVIANRTHQGDDSAVTVDIDVVHTCDLSMFDDCGRGGVGTADYQVRERAHRDSMRDAAEREGAVAGDLMLVSDLDEIPSAAAIEHAAGCDTVLHVCEQRMHAYALDWLHPQCWLGTSTLRLGPGGVWAYSPQEMRDARGGCSQIVDGGWHLTWMGGDTECNRKRGRFSHAERLGVDDWNFASCRAFGYDVNGVKMTPFIPGDYDWPPGLLHRAMLRPEYWRLP